MKQVLCDLKDLDAETKFNILEQVYIVMVISKLLHYWSIEFLMLITMFTKYYYVHEIQS